MRAVEGLWCCLGMYSTIQYRIIWEGYPESREVSRCPLATLKFTGSGVVLDWIGRWRLAWLARILVLRNYVSAGAGRSSFI